MLLAIDVGNTETVFGLYRGQELKDRFRFRTERTATRDEVALQFQLLPREIQTICICSVVPEVDPALDEACRVYLRQIPLWVNSPKEFGADRWVATQMAFHKFKEALVVVSVGTATTFDVIDAQGKRVGGAIAAGLGISTEVLLAKASKLKGIERQEVLKIPSKVVGTNTLEHLQIGLVRGHAALIDGLVSAMAAELGCSLRVLATGGLAFLVGQASKTIEWVEPDLILSGLSFLYQEYICGTRDSFISNRFERPLGD